MTDAKVYDTQIVTPVLRCAFPFLLEKQRPMDDKGEGKYSVVLLIPKTAEYAEFVKELRRLCALVATRRWGPDKSEWPEGLRNPIRDGDTKKKTQGYEGNWFVTCTANDQPGFVDQNLNNVIDKNLLKGGDYIRAQINAFAYPAPSAKRAMNSGVSFGVNHVQYVKRGERFSGRPETKDVFEKIAAGSEPEWSDNNDDGDPFSF